MFVIAVRKSIHDLKIKDAVKQIIQSTHGLHCLLIYPDLKTFRDFYTYYIKKQIKEKNDITLFNPFYETVGTVRQNLSMGHIHVNELQYESDISLIIADSLNQYFGKVSMMHFKDKLVKYAMKKGKTGVSILSDMGSYFFKMQYTELIDYELSLPIQYDRLLKGLCIYNELDFNNSLTEKQKQQLVNHHSMAIRLEST